MDVLKQTLSFESQEGASNRRIIEARIEVLRVQLESVEMDFPTTQATRGAIKELRKMVSPAMPVITSPQYSGMSFKPTGGA